MTRDEILQKITEILVTTFDLPAEKVTADALLRDDLDLDSIDAVDLIVQLKPLINARIQPEAFKAVQTVGDVADALYGLQTNKTPATADNA